jgi:glycine/D-amino acid oxidase-like deaminating enzyme
MRIVSDYRAKSFWLEQASARYIESPALEGLVRADVLIIGGGFTGISAAYHLKKNQPDLRVVLLEADVVGSGASGRSAGLVMPTFGLTYNLIALRFGTRILADAHRYAVRAVAYVGELAHMHDIACDYEPVGLLRVATTSAAARRLQQDMRLAQSLGISGMTWLDAAATRARLDSPTFLGAWHEPRGALVNPVGLLHGLKRLALSVGVEVYERSRVTNLEFAQPVRAQTPHGAVEADKLVLATNAFTAQFARLQSKQYAVYSYIMLTEPLSAAQLDSLGWLGREGIEDTRNLAHYYRLTSDNRLLVGGGDWQHYYGSKLSDVLHVPTYEHLERFTANTFPGLHGPRITHRWGGPVSITLDMNPAIGVIGAGQRIVYSVGCMGHGIATSILNGQTISDLISEQRTELTEAFFVNRTVLPLPPEPLRTPLANGILGVMRAQDEFDERNGLGLAKSRD